VRWTAEPDTAIGRTTTTVTGTGAVSTGLMDNCSGSANPTGGTGVASTSLPLLRSGFAALGAMAHRRIYR
jgi:hypothetical protein